MQSDQWITGGVVVVMVSLLAWGRFGADLVVMGALLTLLVTGVIGANDAIVGFSSPGVITVALLYVVAAGLRETGAITLLSRRLIGRPKTTLAAQARLILPVAVMSAVANNTPIVAAFLPMISRIGRRMNIPVAKLFMPLSFAAILGGLCTLIGTSTNLVIADLYNTAVAAAQATPDDATTVLAGAPRFGMFTVTWVGVPIAIVGLAYILLLGRRLLPGLSAAALDREKARQYMVAMRVNEGSPVIGQTVENAGLRNLPGLFLSRVERESETVLAVAPSDVLYAGDVLVFVGVLESVVDLQTIKGLTPITDEDAQRERQSRAANRLVEVVVSPTSPLINRTVRSALIRTRYGAVIVAVHRHGHRLEGKIGSIRLRPGDTLLLEAGPEFAERFRDSPEFHLVSALPGAAAPRHERAPLSLAILVLMVIAMATEVVPTVVAAMAGAGAMIVSRCVRGPQARGSVDIQVIVVIAAAFGIGHAMTQSGLADTIAHALVETAGGWGPIGLLGAIYALTVLFTTFITNNAAAVLMFPIGMQAALEHGLPPLPVAVCIAIAASAEFSTPIGYQTNLMVQGPGGYRWLDYTRFGGPLTLLAGVIAVVLASIVY